MDIMNGIKEGIPIGVTEGITSTSVKLLLDYLKNRLLAKGGARTEEPDSIALGIEKHLIETDNWCSQVQFLGMSTPKAVDDLTIGLDVHTEPRRFRGREESEKIKQEDDLLAAPGHFLLLGGPGSGKTTTLKRLCRKILLTPPVSTCDLYQFPLVIRLRELAKGASIFSTIADIFELKYHQVEVKKEVESRGKGVSHNIKGIRRGGGQDASSIFTFKHIETRIGEQLIEDAIAEVLNRVNTVLILDGLDELAFDSMESVRKEIVILGRKLNNSKIILSLRSGEYNVDFEGFSILELCPLTKEQIRAIAERWLPDADAFLSCLNALPYYDLADRPLLLTQLLFIFKRYGYLPEQPATIYKKVVRLLLEEWDAQRDITRLSKYAGFDPERKVDFLSALSYHLTYSLQEKRFSEDSLVKAYMRVYQTFNLRESEALMVIREIETHTGILVSGPGDTYEFAHLSLQEYFSANYLVRSPMILDFSYFVSAYPSPLAVAVVLSSAPGSYFAQLVLNPASLKAFTDRSLLSFLSRLCVEKPFFELSERLAFSIFHLYNGFRNVDIRNKLDEIVGTNTVLESMAAALRWYTIRKSKKGDLLELHLKKGMENPYGTAIPETGALPKKFLTDLLNRSSSGLLYEDSKGSIRKLSKRKIAWLQC